MTLNGHFSLSVLLYILIPFPFNWISIFLSHFIFDKYPDFYSKNYKKELVYNVIFILSIILLYLLFISFLIYIYKLQLLTIFFITILSMFPDITEGIYSAFKFFFDKKNLWDNKLWFNHDGFFPFKANNWQFSTSTFRCLTRKQTILFDSILVVFVILILLLFRIL